MSLRRGLALYSNAFRYFSPSTKGLREKKNGTTLAPLNRIRKKNAVEFLYELLAKTKSTFFNTWFSVPQFRSRKLYIQYEYSLVSILGFVRVLLLVLNNGSKTGQFS